MHFEAQAAAKPKNPSEHYWLAYAIGHYSQGISVTKALSQGLGSKVKAAFETAIALAPQHADANIGLGAFHDAVIDKVGSLLGKTTGLAMFQQAMELNPGCGVCKCEYVNGLVVLEGDKKMKDAEMAS